MQFLFALLFFLSPLFTWANPPDGSQQTAATMVKGDILYLEDDYLIVRDISGRENRVHVNGETKIDGVAGKLKSGDKIIAMVTSDGHALSVSLQTPDGGSTPPSPSP
jgi:hypothetical protein